jgi:UDP-N-acetylmuramate dehydrogenase
VDFERELRARFGAILAEAEPLDRHTTIGVGGRARLFFLPRDVDEAAALFAELERLAVPVFILGGGSNLLVKDQGFAGAVVNLSALGECKVAGDRIRAGAGVPLSKVAKRAMDVGLAGMEGLVGIPGTIGGAIFMNAGGRKGEIADVVESVAVLDRRGHFARLTREQVGFRYRGTNLGDLVVVEATLKLRPGVKRDICEEMAHYLRRKHETQPMGQRSAGCVFKNPAPERAAAWLIDTAGLKGRAVGGAEVSPRHANFIVNNGGASAADIFTLIAEVRREVLLKHEAALALEVKVLGERGLEAV